MDTGTKNQETKKPSILSHLQLPRGFRQYPVIVLLEGELFVTSAPSRFPGQDLAASDMIVVSFNYRTNAFGTCGLLAGHVGTLQGLL